jgi:hypothetical protein
MPELSLTSGLSAILALSFIMVGITTASQANKEPKDTPGIAIGSLYLVMGLGVAGMTVRTLT